MIKCNTYGAKNLKKGVNYFYNGDTTNHCLEIVNELKSILNKNIIYLGIYVEEIIN